MEKLTKVLVNGTHRKAFDKHMDISELVLNLPLDTRVFYIKMKKIMVVGARDMVLIQKVKQVDRDTTVIVVKSVEKLADEKHPVSDTKDLQRAIVHLGGYLL